jgi:DNA-binding transcriptional regulator YiaG
MIEKLKELKAKTGLTNLDLARMIGCEERQVYRWFANEAQPKGLYRKSIEKVVRKLSRGE